MRTEANRSALLSMSNRKVRQNSGPHPGAGGASLRPLRRSDHDVDAVRANSVEFAWRLGSDISERFLPLSHRQPERTWLRADGLYLEQIPAKPPARSLLILQPTSSSHAESSPGSDNIIGLVDCCCAVAPKKIPSR